MRASRTVLLSTMLTALLVVSAVPASAVTGEFIAEAEGPGFELRLPVDQELVGGKTTAAITDAPLAEASGVGLLLVEQSHTEATASSDGGQQTDGPGCGTDGLPAGVAALVDGACSTSQASISGVDPVATATATGLAVDVTGDELVDLLVTTLLQPIDEAALGEALDAAEDSLLAPLRAALAEACLAGSEDLAAVYETGADLINAIEDTTGGDSPIDPTVLDPDNACAILVSLTTAPPVIGAPAEVIDTLTERLRAALGDATLVRLAIAESASDAQATAAAVEADATTTGLALTLPPLELAGDLTAVVTQLVEEFVAEVEAIVGEAVVVDDLPTVGELVTQITDAIPAELRDLLADTKPLLAITGAASTATATLDSSGTPTADGTQQPVVVTLSSTFEVFVEDVLGGADLPNPITVPAGETVVLAEGTPLQSTISVGSVEITEVERDGLPGAKATSVGVVIELFEGSGGEGSGGELPELPGGEETEEGGEGAAGTGLVGVTLSGASAAAFGVVSISPASAPPLPATGGGLVLLGLVSLAGAALLRRR